MSDPKPPREPNLSGIKDQLRAQLDAKSSLFDLLSPPPTPKPDPTAANDKELRQVIWTSFWFTVLACIAGIFLVRNTEFIVALPLLLIGILAFRAIRLLRARILALEAELREIRGKSSPEDSQPK